MKKNKIVIIVENGAVTEVRGRDENIEIEILDADNMDSEDFEAQVEEVEAEYPVIL
jgi:hypothetical protein